MTAIVRQVNRLRREAVTLLLPHRCGSCDAVVSSPGFCAPCFSRLQFCAQPACPGCARPMADVAVRGASPYCGYCLSNGALFDFAVSAFVYNDKIAPLILKMKHGDRLDLVGAMARAMVSAWAEASAPAAQHSKVDWVVPVPLHWRRQVERRYNQSLELARQIAPYVEGKLRPDLLIRTRATAQMKKMNRSQRRQNVAGAFAVPPKFQNGQRQLLRGKHVLVIDDVFTTGATLRAVVGTLRRAHVARVSVLVGARVVRPDHTA